LLAFRLHGQFLHWQAHGRTPGWPRLQAVAGHVVLKIIFSPMRQPNVQYGGRGK
jgi:hypothetical protein